MDASTPDHSLVPLSPALEPPASLTTRLYVGGLPSDVTEKELKARFASFGEVHSVELVPSKLQPQANASAVDGSAAGTRRFGYVNVTPASELSLKKCFTAYNGCKWRGGRLRIEKARDDFRVRLEREREADLRAKQEEAERRLQAQRAREALLLPGGEAAGEAATPGSSSAGGGGGGGAFALPSSSSSKRKIEPLKLLWGNTKKVKVVAAAGGFGCGKHKYSFQGVPALPLSDIMAACVYVPSDPPTPPRREAHHVAASEQERSAAQKARGEAVAAKVEAWKRERERKEDKERERQEKREREQERQSAAAASSRDRFTSGVIAKILAQEEERARSQQQALLQEGLPAGAGAGAGGGEPTEEDAGEVEEVKEDEDAGAAEEAEEQDGRQVEDQGKGASRKQQVPALEEEEAAAAGVTSDSKKGKDSTKKKKKKKKKKEEKQKEKKLSEPHGGPAYLGAPSPEQEEGGAAADGPSVELVRVPGRAEAVTVAERRGSPGSHIGGGQDASGTASFEDMAGKVKVAGQGIVAGAGEDPPWTHGRSAALDHESEDGVKAGEFEEEEEDEKEQLEEEEEADGNDDDTEEEEDEVELEHASVADAVPAGEEEEEEDDDDDEDDEEEETTAAAGGVQPRSPAAQEEDDIARALEEERKRHLALLGSMFPDEQHYYKEPSKKKAAPRAGFVSTLRFDPMVDAELPLCDDEGIHVSAAIEDAVVLPEEASLPVPRQPGGASLLPPSKGTRPAGALSGLRAGARGDAPEEEEVVGVGDGGSGEGRDSEDEEEGEGHEVNEEDEEEGANDGAVLEMATALPGDEHEQEEQGQEQEQEMMEQLSAKREPSAKRKRSEAVVPGAVEKAAKKRAPAVKMEEKESIWSAMFRRAGLEDVASDNEDDLEVLEAGEEEDGGEDEVDEGGGGGEEEAEGLDERMYRGPTEREGDASEAKQKKKRKKKKKKKVVQVPKSAPKVQAAADDGAGGGEGEGGVGAEELEGAELMQEGRDEEREAGAGAEAPPILARDEQQVAALTFGGGLEESAKEAPEKNLAENSSREEAGDHRNEEGKGGASLGAEPALGMPDEETVGAHEQAVVGEKPRRKKSKTRKMKAEEGAGVVHAGWEAAADTPEEREGEEAGTAIAALPEAEVTHARDVAEVPGGADASGPSVMSSEAGGAAEEAAEVAAAAEAKDAKWFQRATWKSLTDAEGRVSFSLGAILGVAAAAAAPAGAASAGPLAGEALVRPEAAAAEGSGRSSNEPQRAQEFQATLQAGELLVGGHVEAAEHSAGAHAHFAGTWLGQSAAPAATSSAPAGGQQVEEAAAGILGGLSLAMNGSGAAVLDSEECPFMRPPDAEEEWLATRGLLRQDYRRKQKAASRKGLRVKGPRPART